MLGYETMGEFDFADNPVDGLMIGTVALVGMMERQAVPVIMGANVGTCIMVAFGQIGDGKRFEHAMAAATVHDLYSAWSVNLSKLLATLCSNFRSLGSIVPVVWKGLSNLERSWK